MTASKPQAGAAHWAKYYASLAQRPPPSSFARHVAAKLDGPTRLVELGCGDGRDSVHFAAQGHGVLGIDRCAEAIARATSRGGSARFVEAELPIEAPRMRAHLHSGQPVLVYARFFLHALPEETAARLLTDLAALLGPGARLALEYRTLADADLPKIHPPHYRRFVDPAALQATLDHLGFSVTEATEGQGLSPHGGEDPVLGRVIALRR